jgi:delta24(24(1))-sterol reductase
MLNFWNITGVPFLYCFQSFYILKNQAAITAQIGSPYYYALNFAVLIVGYYVFDSANCQKASCKFPDLDRNLFPHMPWGVLKNPAFIKTPYGNLLCDGWYKYARKMQYTGDIMMAASWGMACGFLSPLPYFYLLFFTCMITHRQGRDEIRCREKYGKYWDQFTKLVPNVFVPDLAFFKWLFFGIEKKMKI